MSDTDAGTVVLRYITALRERDAAAIAAVVAPDAVYRIPGSHPLAGTWVGLDEIARRFLHPMGELFDPTATYAVDINHIISTPDQVALECTVRATTRRGLPYELNISAHFAVSGGQITHMHEYFDTQYFVRTLFGQDCTQPRPQREED